MREAGKFSTGAKVPLRNHTQTLSSRIAVVSSTDEPNALLSPVNPSAQPLFILPPSRWQVPASASHVTVLPHTRDTPYPILRSPCCITHSVPSLSFVHLIRLSRENYLLFRVTSLWYCYLRRLVVALRLNGIDVADILSNTRTERLRNPW